MFAGDIAVVTMAIGKEYKDMVKPGLENKKQYCEQHGYDFICGEELLDPTRPIAWTKILLVQKALDNPKYKWVFWTDADALVMNLAIPLEDLIDEDYNFILTKDFNTYNSGHFFIKNTKWSKNFLTKIYNHTECINHDIWENMAIIKEINENEDVKKNTKILPARLMNSYVHDSLKNGYHKGDFIIHFAGIHERDRLIQLMSDYSKLVVNDNSLITLDYYLGVYGFVLNPQHSSNNEGYMTNAQKQQFKVLLISHPEVEKVAEIGLNGGHSANVFFSKSSQPEKIYFI